MVGQHIKVQETVGTQVVDRADQSIVTFRVCIGVLNGNVPKH